MVHTIKHDQIVQKFSTRIYVFQKEMQKSIMRSFFFNIFGFHSDWNTCDYCCLKHTWVWYNLYLANNVNSIRYLDVPFWWSAITQSCQNTLHTRCAIWKSGVKKCGHASFRVSFDCPRFCDKFHWFSSFSTRLENFHIS